MIDPMSLSLAQKFELERSLRAIDEARDIEELRRLAKQLAHSWFSQKAATQWMMKQTLGAPPTVCASATMTTATHPHSNEADHQEDA
jgi:hypothetical protein